MRSFLIQIVDADGSTISVTPADFERLAGKAHCKKWKHSIRVCPTEQGTAAVSLAAWAQHHKVQLPVLGVKPGLTNAKSSTVAGTDVVSDLSPNVRQTHIHPLMDIASIRTRSGASCPLNEQPLEHIFNTPTAPLDLHALQQDRHYGTMLPIAPETGAVLPTADNSNSSGSADQDLYLMNLVGLSQEDMLQLLDDTGSALSKEAAATRLRIAATEGNLADADPSGDLGRGTPVNIISTFLPESAAAQQHQQHQPAIEMEQQQEQQMLRQLQQERYTQQRHQQHQDQHQAMPQHQQHQHKPHGRYQAHQQHQQHLPAEPPQRHAQKRPLDGTTQLTTGEAVDLTLLLQCVQSLGGCQRVTRGHSWQAVALALQLPVACSMQLMHLYIAELLHLERCSVVVPVPRQHADGGAV